MEPFKFTSENLEKLIKIFDTNFLAVQIMAIDKSDPYLKIISHSCLNIITPPTDNIISETVVITSIHDFIKNAELLINSEPRCISLYEIEDITKFKPDTLNGSQEALVRKGIINYSISVIADEYCVKIVFNHRRYDKKLLLSALKQQFKDERKS